MIVAKKIIKIPDRAWVAHEIAFTRNDCGQSLEYAFLSARKSLWNNEFQYRSSLNV